MMLTIEKLLTNPDLTLDVYFKGGEARRFDVKPLLGCEAFSALRDPREFSKIINGGYFVAWENEADLSADTLFIEGTRI